MAAFADDPDKAWAERYFLLTSPAWIAAVALVVLTGWLKTWGDVGYLAFSLGAAAPAVVGPLAFSRGRDVSRGVPHWVKVNVWVAVLVFFGTYFGTHYFFDLMGMRYAFPSAWTFDAALVGRSGQRVPVFMYPLTQAYFVTYFTVLSLTYRAVSRRLGLGGWGRAALLLALAYAVAFAETFFMATGYLDGLFWYEKRDRMLALGSVGYATYFVVGLPLFRCIDEPGRTSLGEVLVRALAASMGVLLLLEVWARWIGAL